MYCVWESVIVGMGDGGEGGSSGGGAEGASRTRSLEARGNSDVPRRDAPSVGGLCTI